MSLGKYEWKPDAKLIGPLVFDGIEVSGPSLGVESEKGKTAAVGNLVGIKIRFVGIDSKSLKNWVACGPFRAPGYPITGPGNTRGDRFQNHDF